MQFHWTICFDTPIEGPCFWSKLVIQLMYLIRSSKLHSVHSPIDQNTWSWCMHSAWSKGSSIRSPPECYQAALQNLHRAVGSIFQMNSNNNPLLPMNRHDLHSGYRAQHPWVQRNWEAKWESRYSTSTCAAKESSLKWRGLRSREQTLPQWLRHDTQRSQYHSWGIPKKSWLRLQSMRSMRSRYWRFQLLCSARWQRWTCRRIRTARGCWLSIALF